MKLRRITAMLLACMTAAVAMPLNEDVISDFSIDAVAETTEYDQNLIYVKVDELIDGTYDYVSVTGCDASVTSVVIPAEIEGLPVLSIEDNAFSDCTGLTSVVIPDSVTSIGKSAFYNCTSLTDVTIGNGVASIGDEAFGKCESLTGITLPDSLTSMGIRTFMNCYALTSIIIPDSVTDAGSGVFVGCVSLESAMLSENMTSLASYPHYGSYDGYFEGCGKLESIVIPDSITEIGTDAFRGCENLSNATIGDGVVTFGYDVFADCTSLTSIVIPGSVKELGDALRYSSLTSVRIESTDCTMGWYRYTIPVDAVIYGYWFSTAHVYAWDYSHEFISIDEEITDVEPNLLYEIVDENLDGTNDYVKITDCYPWTTGGAIPAEIDGFPVEVIEDSAFDSCTELVSIRIPESVESVSVKAFYNCTNLKGVRFDNYKCEIYDSADTISNTEAIIYGYDNSTAQTYAEKYGREFVSLGEAPAEPEPEQSLGDLDGDGEINSSDASAVLTEYALLATGGASSLTEAQKSAADVNKDGAIDSSDASAILSYYAYTATGGTDSFEDFLS